MQNFTGKVAVLTGAASGIGLGIARALAQAGARVALLDLHRQACEEAATEVLGETLPLAVDVSDREQVYDAAEKIQAAFGRIDIAINNAGVAYNARPLHETPDAMIDWSVGVNIMGVLNGIKAFVPRIIATGDGGHVVNTSSIGGFQVRKSALWHQSLYAATKYAVTALSEGLRLDLEDLGIGVSVLAPSSVATNIGVSDRNRPDRFGGATTGAQAEAVHEMLNEIGMAPDKVGHRVLQGIRDNEAYIFTHMEGLPLLEARHARIEQAFQATRAFLDE